MFRTYLLQQLPIMLPLALMYLVGIILALIHLNRLGTPAALALAGCVILLLMTLASPIAQAYVLALPRDGEMPATLFTRLMGAIGIVRLLFDIVGFSLMLAAVFMRRRPRGEELLNK